MELEKLELNELITFWETSSKNIRLKTELENELQKRIENNTNFTKEYFFEQCLVKGKDITCVFIPTTEAYQNYGKHITVKIVFDETEIEFHKKTFMAKEKTRTYGNMKSEITIDNNLTPIQIKMLSEIGFNTNEISKIINISI